MELGLNYNRPLIMHVDLNSCFAMIEQQANPLLRNRPIGVAAYDTPSGIILAASYEAKALGIKTGTPVREARLLCPNIIIMTPDPDKYFDAHRRFKQILEKYTDALTPKSVDEFVIDFTGSEAIRRGLDLEGVGQRIKRDITQELGEYITVNIGIGPNRFLAKLAAGLNKPNGMDKISAHNIRQTYSRLNLIDLPGINRHYSARLNLAGIYTPLEFLDAPLWKLKDQVFLGVNGFYWFLRLRGHEIDAVTFARKSFGQQYALGQKTIDREAISRLLMKLCEKTGRRLRRDNYQAWGIGLWLAFADRSYWSKRHKLVTPLFSTSDIYRAAQTLLALVSINEKVTNIGVNVYGLTPTSPLQLSLFSEQQKQRPLALAADQINDRYGEFTLIPALMANMDDVIIKRVAFGQRE